jgi:predicted amidohydrolase
MRQLVVAMHDTRMRAPFHRSYDFTDPLDDLWEVIPQKDWSFDLERGRARFVNRGSGKAEIFLRPCSIYGDTVEFQLVPADSRAGTFVFGFLGGFEHITFEVDLTAGDLQIRTHEFHKAQPRYCGKVQTKFSNLKVIREKDDLPGLPYEGSSVVLLLDDEPVANVGQIDIIPETLFTFGFKGPGEISLASFSIFGPKRPRPEYVRVGLWQQSSKPTTAQSVNALIEGVRQASEAGVQILLTPETSLTSLRPDDPELSNRDLIQSELRRFQEAVSKIPNAPYTLTGYPEWIEGSEVEGATLDEVKINAHRFVRPDGALGPRMAKVHSCEEGLWHGRKYNLQRVCGVEVAVGVCHDGRYPDVWSVGVMGGARLCLHPLGAGTPSGPIPTLLESYRDLGSQLDAFWVRTNAGGGSAIVYPGANAKQRETILAVPKDLTNENPAYPNYSPMGDLLAHARIRLWDASGVYPLRTLRSGATGHRMWSSLIPPVQEV